MFELHCSACGHRVQGDDSLAGKHMLCPHCKAEMAVSSSVPATQTHEKQSSLALRMIPYVVGGLLVLGAISLIIPAVQKVREAEARTQSTNNLKQIGLGAQSFHDGNKRLPFNGIAPGTKLTPKDSNIGYFGNATTDNPASGSWLFQILPYTDSSPVFHLSGKANSDEIPIAFTNMGWGSYRCPGRGRQAFITNEGPWSDFHINILLNSQTKDGRLIAAFDAPDVKRTLLGITDGTSFTIFAGHGYIGRDAYSATTSQGNWSSVMWRGGTEGTGRALGVSLPARLPDELSPVTKLMRDDWQRSTGITSATTPQPWGGPFSQGALFALCDGTVKMIPYSWPQDSDPNSFGRFLTPAHGEGSTPNR